MWNRISGNDSHNYKDIAIDGGFFHWTWWFSIAMFNYQRGSITVVVTFISWDMLGYKPSQLWVCCDHLQLERGDSTSTISSLPWPYRPQTWIDPIPTPEVLKGVFTVTLWYLNVAMENGHWNSGFSHQKWGFSIATLNYQGRGRDYFCLVGGVKDSWLFHVFHYWLTAQLSAGWKLRKSRFISWKSSLIWSNISHYYSVHAHT